MTDQPAPQTTREMQAAERVVRDLKADLFRWMSYGGPVMPGQREVEQKLAGAEMVLTAMKAAPRPNVEKWVTDVFSPLPPDEADTLRDYL